MNHIVVHLLTGGGYLGNFELTKKLSLAKLDKSIQKLMRIYREKSEWFEIPDFAQKVY